MTDMPKMTEENRAKAIRMREIEQIARDIAGSVTTEQFEANAERMRAILAAADALAPEGTRAASILLAAKAMADAVEAVEKCAHFNRAHRAWEIHSDDIHTITELFGACGAFRAAGG